MPKIDLETAPTGAGSRYPAPHDVPCQGRRWLRLGDAAGLTKIGINQVTLAPGVWSSQRHWHAQEDEFVYVLQGVAVLVTDSGETLLRAGDCAGFPAGSRDGHMLRNDSSEAVVFLVVSNRDDADWGEYPDLDMRFTAGRYSGKGGGFTRKDGSAF
jgi:uncharacterized cupin superfamily protein